MRTAYYQCVACGNRQLEPCVVAGRHLLAGACTACDGDMVCDNQTVGDARLPPLGTGLLALASVGAKLGRQLALDFGPGLPCRHCGTPMVAAGDNGVVCDKCDGVT